MDPAAAGTSSISSAAVREIMRAEWWAGKVFPEFRLVFDL